MHDSDIAREFKENILLFIWSIGTFVPHLIIALGTNDHVPFVYSLRGISIFSILFVFLFKFKIVDIEKLGKLSILILYLCLVNLMIHDSTIASSSAYWMNVVLVTSMIFLGVRNSFFTLVLIILSIIFCHFYNRGFLLNTPSDWTYEEWANNYLVDQVLSLASLYGALVFMKLYFHKSQLKLLAMREDLNSSALISETDVNGVITFVNDKFCQISKYSSEEIVGNHYRMFDSGILSKTFDEKFWENSKKGEVWKGELSCKAKDGSIFWVENMFFPVFNKENIMVGYSTIGVDITTRKQAEAIDRHGSKLAHIGEVAAGVGHEINNPLTVSAGNIKLIEKLINKEPFDLQKVNEKIEKVKDANNRIRKIVDGLRTFSRSDGDTRFETVSISQALDKTLDLVSDIYEKEGVFIVKDYIDTELCTLGRLGKIQQIIMNLISNAKDATEGKDNREIKLSLRKINNSELAFSVSDNGTGIKTEVIDSILEPFFTTKPEGVGTGIGLGLVDNLIKEMGGELKVESQLGVGSCFTVTLPLVKGETSKVEAISSKLEKIYHGNVLVVDDEDNVREIIVEDLKAIGFNVDQADSGKEALVHVNNKKYDFIFTDMKMPKMNGEEFIKKAKETPNGDTKYIIVTGGITTSFSKEKRDYLWSLADGYILKPYDESDIFKTLDKIINDKKVS